MKSYGQRLPKCGTYQVSEKLAEGLSAELREILVPLFKEIESLNGHIKQYDERMEKIAKEVYPEVSLLKQVKGVGTQIALDLCPDPRGPVSVCEESRGGLFSGVTTWPEELWGERTPEGHQQRRRPVFADNDGAGSALHSGTVWRRQRSAEMGTETCGEWREKCQEASGGGRGSKAGGAPASAVGRRRGVRTTAQQSESNAGSGLASCDASSRAQPPSPGDCDKVLGPDSHPNRWDERSIHR